MSRNQGGWTLVAVVANDGVRKWNNTQAFLGTAAYGTLAALKKDYKSMAYGAVKGNDLLLVTPEYSVGFHGVLGEKAMASWLIDKWPVGCSTQWLHGKPEWSENLSATQADLFSLTLRGHDSNAISNVGCFPGGDEGSAITLHTTNNGYVALGIGNTPEGMKTWNDHDLSMRLKKTLVKVTNCNKNNWPCNPQGKALSFEGQWCYDTSCTQPWVRIYVR
jgi:hypothetical protein